MTNTAQPTERRSRPRVSGLPCPHCDSTRLSAHHLRDTGDLDPAKAVELGYCPTLVEKRNRPAIAVSVELAPTDAREAARLDEWTARLDADDMAAAYSAELARAIPGLVEPLAGSRGIGEQRGRLARLTRSDLTEGKPS